MVPHRPLLALSYVYRVSADQSSPGEGGHRDTTGSAPLSSSSLSVQLDLVVWTEDKDWTVAGRFGQCGHLLFTPQSVFEQHFIWAHSYAIRG